MTKQGKDGRRKLRKALADTRVAFVGAGVMAESIIAGLLAKGMLAPGQVVASHPRAERRHWLTMPSIADRLAETGMVRTIHATPLYK